MPVFCLVPRTNSSVHCAIVREAEGVLLVANGSLWVDGRRIYEASGLGVRLIDDARGG